ITFDAMGTTMYATCDDNRVRRITSSGSVTVIAGTGAQTTSGDNGQATNASINSPQGIALDASGNIFIAEFAGARVRRIDSQGVITTFAGTGVQGIGGDNGPASAATFFNPSDVLIDGSGALYIADQGAARVRRVNQQGTISTFAGSGARGSDLGDGNIATQASL